MMPVLLVLLAATGLRAPGPVAVRAPGPMAVKAAGPDTLRASAPAPGMLLIYWPGHAALARQLAGRAAAFLPMPGLPASPLPDTAAPVTVFLAPDGAAFDSLTGGEAPEWSAGVSLIGRDRIVLPAYASSRSAPQDLSHTLRHELAHILLHRYLGPVTVPRWFDEGYAQLAAHGFDAGAAWEIRIAFALHRAPPLDSLSLQWPAAAGRARLAYLLSATAVQYLVQMGGTGGLAALLARWRVDGALDAALRHTYGVTLGQFEDHWAHFVRRRYGWTFFLSQAIVFWFFASLLLIAFWLRRRRTNRLKLARLRAGEPPDQPAYWLEGGAGPGNEADEVPGQGRDSTGGSSNPPTT